MTIEAREMELAQCSLVTTSSLESHARHFVFPESVRGLKILDTGSGTSTMVTDLRNMGAIAFGLDYGYENLDLLSLKAGEFITNHYFNKNVKNTLEACKNQFFTDINQRNYFVAGLASNLPFKDDGFDIVFSSGLHGTILIFDYEVLLASTIEALRVLKPGGTFQIAPWILRSWTDAESQNSVQLLSFLKSRNIAYEITPVEGRQNCRLVITKPIVQSNLLIYNVAV